MFDTCYGCRRLENEIHQIMKSASHFFAALGLILAIFAVSNNAQRTKDKMYDTISGSGACFRRMNGTHQIGCSSIRKGSTGVVHFVEKEADLEPIIKCDTGIEYVPVLPIELFKRPLVDKLLTIEHISGMVIYDSTNGTDIQSYSHEDTCPNRYSNLAGTCDTEWNPEGTDLLLRDFRIPLFYLNHRDQTEKIRDCFVKFNNFSFETHPDRSLCALELEGFMFGSKDTPTCIRRSNSRLNLNPTKYCDPLGDSNIWASLYPVGRSNHKPTPDVKANTKYVVVAARLDSTSMFNDLVPGANSPVSGLVTLLATADMLKRIMSESAKYAHKNVLYLLFHGESYDYIGSQRIVYDMQKGVFPNENYTDANETVRSIAVEDIDTFIELNHLSLGKEVVLYSRNGTEITEFISKLKKNAKNPLKEVRSSVPPSSVQSFIRARPDIKHVVLANYDGTYTSKFYNSIYDNAAKIGFKYVESGPKEDFPVTPGSVQEFIGNMTEVLAKSLYEEITTTSYTGSARANAYVINELFHCYLENANCTIHRAVQRKQFKKLPLSLYVGVPAAPNMLTSLIGLTLSLFTGEKIAEEPCNSSLSSHVYHYFNMSDNFNNLNVSKCFRVSMNFTPAESPAFILEDYDWTSGEYSTWSESTWGLFNVRLFLKPSKAHEIMTITVGTLTFGLSTLLVLLMNAKSRTLFEVNTVTPTNC